MNKTFEQTKHIILFMHHILLLIHNNQKLLCPTEIIHNNCHDSPELNDSSDYLKFKLKGKGWFGWEGE